MDNILRYKYNPIGVIYFPLPGKTTIDITAGCLKFPERKYNPAGQSNKGIIENSGDIFNILTNLMYILIKVQNNMFKLCSQTLLLYVLSILNHFRLKPE